MLKLNIYVNSVGIDPLTGDIYPEATPKMRSIQEISRLLNLNYELYLVDGYFRHKINKATFEKDYAKELNTNNDVKITSNKQNNKKNKRR